MNRTLQEKLAELETRAKGGKAEKERVTYNVDKLTVHTFKAICDEKGIEYSHVVELLMRDYVDMNQGRVVDIGQATKKSSGHD